PVSSEPLCVRAAFVLSEECSANCALTKKTTTATRIHATIATTIHLTTRPQLNGLRGGRRSAWRSRRRSEMPPGSSRRRKTTGLRSYVDNDATVAMLAEHRLGAARGASEALMLTIGTGVGGGIVSGGRLVRGAHGSAGEPGHMSIDMDGPPCPGDCPGRGCL